MSKIDELCKEIKATTISAQLSTGNCQQLFDIATLVFDTFEGADQICVMALMLGMLMAAIDGQPCEAETEWGVFVSEADRIKLFLAHYEMAFVEHKEILKTLDPIPTLGTVQ